MQRQCNNGCKINGNPMQHQSKTDANSISEFCLQFELVGRGPLPKPCTETHHRMLSWACFGPCVWGDHMIWMPPSRHIMWSPTRKAQIEHKRAFCDGLFPRIPPLLRTLLCHGARPADLQMVFPFFQNSRKRVLLENHAELTNSNHQ